MVKINKIFFADNFQMGQFGKINAYGMNTGTGVTVDQVPYTFTSHLVIWGSLDANNLPDFDLIIKVCNKQGEIYETLSTLLDTESLVSKETYSSPPYSLFAIVPVQFIIKEVGSIDISISMNGNVIYNETYDVGFGAAPNLAIKTHLPQSQIFSGDNNADSNFVIDLLSITSRTLKIFDGFLKDPADLKHLLSKVDKNVAIEVIIKDEFKKKYLHNTELFKLFPNLRMRFSLINAKEAHDRIVIINESEYFHFGHSLAAINKGKLSRVSKIIDKQEIDILNSELLKIESSTEKF